MHLSKKKEKSIVSIQKEGSLRVIGARGAVWEMQGMLGASEMFINKVNERGEMHIKHTSALPDRETENVSRRGFLGGIGIAGGGLSLSSLLAACNREEQQESTGTGIVPGSRRYRAAFSNNSLKTSTWCMQGWRAAEAWGRWFGVDITWYDGASSVDQQRKAIDEMAEQKWDFVAIQPVSVDTVIGPVQKLLDNGIPVIQMDTEIDSSRSIHITTFLEPDNIYMGEVSTRALFEKMGGRGKVIMTQGHLGHTGAQGRAKGFYRMLGKYPDIELIAKDAVDWELNRVTEVWTEYLARYKDIDGAFFHNDDMALTALKVIQDAGRNILVASVDALPAAIEAVINGSMVATVRNPAARIHWGALLIGILAANGTENIPTHILADGPVVTQQNGPGLLFLEDQFLL